VNITLAAALLTGAASIGQSPAVAVSDVQRAWVGTCEGQGRSFDLGLLMTLENRTIQIDRPDGRIQVRINGEHFFIERVREAATQTLFGVNTGNEVDPHADLDVELKLAYFEGQLVIYWKETFQHKIYRQGLFKVEADHLSLICTGRGGITSVE
jgi:hypothetical protein